MNKNEIAILGAGISGLTTAWSLKKNGVPADVFDRKGEPGGSIKSVEQAGWNYEYGPNTMLLRDTAVEQFLKDVNVSDQIVKANPEAVRRFVVKEGELREVPTSPGKFFSTDLFSRGAKWRLAGELFKSRLQKEEPSVAEFVEHRLGKEVLDYGVNPFVAGIYTGRPESLSLNYTFPKLAELSSESRSLFLGGLKRAFSKESNDEKIPRKLISIKGGLQQLPLLISKELEDVHYNHDVEKVYRNDEGRWFVKTHLGTYGPYKNVISTMPLYRWSRELLPIGQAKVDIARNVDYPPVSIMVLGYKKSDITHSLDGFGFLVPEVEERNILGALFSSTLFKNRAPDGHHLLTVFVGGARQPELAELESDKILKLVQKDLRDLIGAEGEPVFKDHIFWPKSIPQYNTGYGEVLDMFNRLEEENPGLRFAGNYRGGVSLPDCIKNGLSLGESLI